MKPSEWIEARGLTRCAFAEMIGVVPSYVTALCEGDIWPSRETWFKIRRVTQGAVGLDDILPPDPNLPPEPIPRYSYRPSGKKGELTFTVIDRATNTPIGDAYELADHAHMAAAKLNRGTP